MCVFTDTYLEFHSEYWRHFEMEADSTATEPVETDIDGLNRPKPSFGIV